MRPSAAAVLAASVLALALASLPFGALEGQAASARDTVHVTVGSAAVNGHVYKEHAARVRVIRDGADGVQAEWTNVLTLGDSAGRPVQRWVTTGKRKTPDGKEVAWEIRQNYDAVTLAPYSYWRTSGDGAELRLVIDGPRIRGTRRAPGGAEAPVSIDLPGAAFMANASDLVPPAVGMKAGTVMTAPMWDPGSNQYRVSIFIVLPERTIDVEGTPWKAWPVEERMRDGGALVATWYMTDRSPYMLAGEVPLPNGVMQRMTEIAVPMPR